MNKKRMGSFVLLVAISLVFLATVVACGVKEDLPQINMADREQVPLISDEPLGDQPLKVAVAAMISSKESIIYYEHLLEYLGRELNRPIQIIQRKTYEEVNDLLLENQVDFAFICTYAYVLGKEEGLELVAAPQVAQQKTYQNYMIVHKNSQIESFEDLKGKKFAFTDPLSFTGRLYALHKLQQMGYSPEEFFSETIYTFSHDNSIRAVYRGLVDGASIDGLILEYLYTLDQKFYDNIKIIHKSEGFGMPPVVMPPGNELLKQQLQAVFTNMHLKEESKDILDNLLIDKFFIPQEDDYQSVCLISSAVIIND